MAALFGVFVVYAIVGNAITGIDARCWWWFITHRSNSMTTVMQAAAWLFDPPMVALFSGIMLTAVAIFRRRFALEALTFIAIESASLTTHLLKDVIGRHRPPVVFRLTSETNFSFPSGHATAAAALMTAIVVYVWLTYRLWQTLWIGLLGLAVTVFVAVSRMYLGVHWITDVIAGSLIGCGVVCCVTAIGALLINAIQRHPHTDAASHTAR
ncbi:phosphatase PAP2 family protein [Corynebacterium choanae]|uniref:phosphatase PAP2 family protein n=1 Tax=Corynebacterium choanae TaxID=1862358 RepID=UPI0019D0640B|nr:phosphatase PAP2 family protein [Corynebacterium choanae]